MASRAPDNPAASSEALPHSSPLESTTSNPERLADTNSLLNGSESLSSVNYAPVHKDERELSEEELRRLFEDEEIERFLELFTDHVSEVSLSGPRNRNAEPPSTSLFVPANISEGQVTPAFTGCGAEDEWISIDPGQVPPPSRISIPASDARCVSEHIAYKYLLPTLPPARPRPDRFTMGQLRLTVQRLYLVIHPAYSALFSRAIALATWESRSRSTVYCILFWALWYRNLLMPAFFARILYSLMRRKLLPYPTLAELRERRREAARSEELGEQIFLRLKATSSSNLMEAWRLFRVFSKPNKNKTKPKVKTEKRKDKIKDEKKHTGTEKTSTDFTSNLSEITGSLAEVDEATVLDSPTESKEEGDFKKALLYALNDIADLHERVKNIFLWRVPSASASFAALLAFLILFTTFLPAKYIVKLALFIVGFLYWHVVPIIASLPPADRSRLPPLFENSQTDAEYAMVLISQRIARGEDVQPLPRKSQRKPKKAAEGPKGQSAPVPVGDKLDPGVESLANSDGNTTIHGSGDAGAIPPAERPREVDWQKWGERAANVRDWAVQGRRMVSKNEIGEEDAGAGSDGETRTFPAHHKTSPGMLTLTRTKLLFTPITSARPKICIALDDVRGVKKIGINAVPGLSVKWHGSPTSDSYGEMGAGSAEESGTVEERFLWVGGRDEVFARLVGWGGRKWLKV
ncbi:hypothetical protein M0805_004817 [Coniferiporia weirii]|nr:hypothetical protein M0805_004817 [Coniferiporia weirii]